MFLTIRLLHSFHVQAMVYRCDLVEPLSAAVWRPVGSSFAVTDGVVKHTAFPSCLRVSSDEQLIAVGFASGDISILQVQVDSVIACSVVVCVIVNGPGGVDCWMVLFVHFHKRCLPLLFATTCM